MDIFWFQFGSVFCSMLNWMIYFRGHSSDYDEWEELGNPGWGWEDVLPFFKSAEKWAGPNSDAIYGTEGRFNIMPNPFLYRVIVTLTRPSKFLAKRLRETRPCAGKQPDAGFAQPLRGFCSTQLMRFCG